jgi:hypothetical protein
VLGTNLERSAEMIVETSRLKLRDFTVEDAEFVLRLVNESSFVSNKMEKEQGQRR